MQCLKLKSHTKTTPKHEEKEQKIASKIKDKADDLLDMHKEELTCSENGQWDIKKAVRQPVIGSHNAYEIGPRGEGKASHAKYHGGDPRHVDTKGPKTRAGNEREIPDTVAYVPGSSRSKQTANKPKTFTSGVSDLSTHYDVNESGRGGKVKLNKK